MCKVWTDLFLLRTTTAASLCRLNTGLVALDLRLSHAHHATRCLPGPLEIPNGRLAEQINLGKITLDGAFDGNYRLNEERVGVFEVEMHKCHHRNAHQLALVCSRHLTIVVLLNRSGDKFWFFS